VTAHASVYTLVLMSVDRYLAVVHPICSLTLRTARNAAILLAIVWVIIVLANAPLFSDFAVRKIAFRFRFRSVMEPRSVLTVLMSRLSFQTAIWSENTAPYWL
jgi:hypothetical protein